jgi:hypothetical protein
MIHPEVRTDDGETEQLLELFSTCFFCSLLGDVSPGPLGLRLRERAKEVQLHGQHPD